MKWPCAILLAPLLLTACGSDTGPGGVTANEARALDDAAEMLEGQRLPDSAILPPAAQPQPAQEPAPPAK